LSEVLIRGEDTLDAAILHHEHRVAIGEAVSLVQALGISLVRAVSVEDDLWQAQNTYYELMEMIAPLKLESPGHLPVELFRKVGHSLGIAVPEAVDPAIDKRVISMPHSPELQLSAAAEIILQLDAFPTR